MSIALIAVVCMSTSVALIRKPLGWDEPKDKFNLPECWHIIKNPLYLMIWLVFYLNITCGLALISFEKDIALTVGITSIGVLASLTAFFNTMGRFCYSTISDWFNRKAVIYVCIFGSSVLAMIMGLSWMHSVPIAIMLCIVNAGYGGGFSTLPTLLQSKFGMDKISMIHGFALSAWAWAGLSGNQLSNLIINKMHMSYGHLFAVLAVLYLISLLVSYKIYKS